MTQQRRIKLILEYLGTNYVGWQLQPNGVSIQHMVEGALAKLVNHDVRVNASGRTDSGVHALYQPVDADVTTSMTDEDIMRGMNALLPHDIAVKEVATVSPDWSARHDATEKTYQYIIHNSQVVSVFDYGRVWHIKKPLDVAPMLRAAESLVGKHDFTSFQSSGCAAKSPVRDLIRLDIKKDGDRITFTLTASGFLKQMVRNIVGTLVEVGRGKLTVGKVKDILTACDRTKAGPCAPPEGLYLIDVIYDK